MEHWTTFSAIDEQKLKELVQARRESIETNDLTPTWNVIKIRALPARTKARFAATRKQRLELTRLRQLNAPDVVIENREFELNPREFLRRRATQKTLSKDQIHKFTGMSINLSVAFKYELGGYRRDDEIVEWILLPFDRQRCAWGGPRPKKLPKVPRSILGWSAKDARRAYRGTSVLRVLDEAPFADFDFFRNEALVDRANFTPAGQLDLPLRFFRAVQSAPRPSLAEWCETFPFIPQFQIADPESLLPRAKWFYDSKLSRAYRRLNALIRFYERAQRRGFGVLLNKGSA
ncbi:MAG: hypothetical protein ACT4TC_10915 [Myxococcaceae bacterium]